MSLEGTATAQSLRAHRTSLLTLSRVACGLDRKDLAQLAGVNPRTISRLERGLNHPQYRTAQRIADALGVEVQALWPEEANR